MKINGHRQHLGLRSNDRRRRIRGTVRAVVTLLPRPSPEPDLVVTWYPHRDAPSLLPPDADARSSRYLADHAIALVARTRSQWSWLG